MAADGSGLGRVAAGLPFGMTDLQAPYPLQQRDVNAFRQNGHVLLRGVGSPEVMAHYQPLIHAASKRFNTELRALADRDTYGKAFLQIMNLWRRDPKVAEFVLARRFAEVAARLLGVERVRMYHDQALYKEPGGGPTPWHQDQYYWPLDTTETITMWMPLVDITRDMGMLDFASGSQADGRVNSTEISDDSERLFDDVVKAKGYDVTEQTAMRAGDATWHQGWTIHRAGPNQSPDTTREVITVIYFADGARVTQPVNDAQENDRQTWLMGRAVGAVADSELNPVL